MKRFIYLNFKKEEIECLNPVNLLEMDSVGEDFQDYFNYDSFDELFRIIKKPDLNNQYLVYAGFCNEMELYNEDTEEGILIDEKGVPLLVDRELNKSNISNPIEDKGKNISGNDSKPIVWKGILEKIHHDKTLVLRMPLQFLNGELVTRKFRSSTNHEHGSIQVSGTINDNKLELKIAYENHHPVLNSKQVIINAKSEDGHFYEGNWITNTATGVFCVFNPLKAY